MKVSHTIKEINKIVSFVQYVMFQLNYYCGQVLALYFSMYSLLCAD